MLRMETFSISALLEPFVAAPLSEAQLQSISTYIDLLLRWNARVNLTSVRQPEAIITRHFGESIFTAEQLFPEADRTQAFAESPEQSEGTDVHLIDIGSGAGFPGLPIKIRFPELQVTLIESIQKKATFLREVVRSLQLTNVDVFCGRAEGYAGDCASVVTLRAVERFDEILPVAASLAASGGRMALLIGRAQSARAERLAPNFSWSEPVPIPLSATRILRIATKAEPI
jgi:16S rRNA (guanine527-N7)-methyltransferase